MLRCYAQLHLKDISLEKLIWTNTTCGQLALGKLKKKNIIKFISMFQQVEFQKDFSMQTNMLTVQAMWSKALGSQALCYPPTWLQGFIISHLNNYTILFFFF